jgi:uncharacterized paraquat-inducible protein A
MGKAFEYVWSIPLIGGILALIALLTPVASFNVMGVSWDWWMWTLSVMGVSGYGTESVFISDVDFIIPSLITSMVMILSILLLFSIAAKARTRKFDLKNFESISIITGVLLIGTMIYYLIAMDNAFFDGMVIEGVPFPAGLRFWEVFNPGFGVIGPFLTVVFAFIGAATFRYYSNRREDLFPSKMESFERKEPIEKLVKGVRFCPECGQGNISETQRFCMNCGFDLRTI